jgi:hypothetical protein
MKLRVKCVIDNGIIYNNSVYHKYVISKNGMRLGQTIKNHVNIDGYEKAIITYEDGLPDHIIEIIYDGSTLIY